MSPQIMPPKTIVFESLKRATKGMFSKVTKMGRKNDNWTAQKPILFIIISIKGVTKPSKIKDIKKAPLFIRIKIDKKNKNVNVKLFFGNIAKK